MDGPTAALLDKHASLFSRVAKQLLHDLPLPWKTRHDWCGRRTMGDGRRFATRDLLDFYSASRPGASAFVGADADGHMQLFLPDGTCLLPTSSRVLQPLEDAGHSDCFSGGGGGF